MTNICLWTLHTEDKITSVTDSVTLSQGSFHEANTRFRAATRHNSRYYTNKIPLRYLEPHMSSNLLKRERNTFWSEFSEEAEYFADHVIN